MEDFKALVATCLSPLMISLGLLLWGWWRFRKSRRSAIALLLAGTLLLLLGSLSGWTFERRRELEFLHPPLNLSELPDEPLQIVVLGTGFNPDGYLPANSRVGGAFLSRLIEGLRIHRARPDAELIVSIAGPTDDADKLLFWEEIQPILGLKAEKARIITTAESSLDEAVEVAKVNQGQLVVLATSAGHMPRAATIFQDEGMRILPAPTDYSFVRAGSERDRIWPRWVPSTGGIGSNHAWLYEAVASVWQWARRTFGIPRI